MGVLTGEQHLATSDWFEGRMPIGPHDTRQQEGQIQKEENSDKSVGRETP